MSTIPDWMPTDAWAGYLAMRKQIKKPASERAIMLAVALLTAMHEKGEDVGAVLDQSTMNSWQGLFPVAERRNVSDERRAPRTVFPSLGKHGQATANNLQDWLEDYGNG